MQGDGDVVGLGHVGDLARLGDAASMGGIGLQDVDVAFLEDALEVPARVKPLAQGDGRVAHQGDLLERLVVLAEHRLLDEHQAELLQLLHQHLGHGLVHPAMEVHADAEVRTAGVADGGDVGDHLVDLVVGVDELHLFAGVHLDGGKALGLALQRLGRGLRRAIAADPGIDADAVAHLAAEQFVHRHAQGFALDVPQRLVDAGQGTHVDAAAPIEAAAVEHRPVVFDVARVLADQVVG